MQDLRMCVLDAGDGRRLGGVSADRVYDLARCWRAGRVLRADLPAREVPSRLDEFIAGGADVLASARVALAWAAAGGAPASYDGEPLHFGLGGVRLKAPIGPNTKVICMAHVYKTHADIGGKVRVADLLRQDQPGGGRAR